MIIRVWTDRSGQTIWTQIGLRAVVQSDSTLFAVLSASFGVLLYAKPHRYKFSDKYTCPIFYGYHFCKYCYRKPCDINTCSVKHPLKIRTCTENKQNLKFWKEKKQFIHNSFGDPS